MKAKFTFQPNFYMPIIKPSFRRLWLQFAYKHHPRLVLLQPDIDRHYNQIVPLTDMIKRSPMYDDHSDSIKYSLPYKINGSSP